MVSAINSALSGLAASGKRLEVSADNIANQFSVQPNGAPYTAKRVQQITLGTGGVQAKVSDTGRPVNPDQEPLNQNLAAYDFKANLKTIKVADEMQQALLDIKT